MICVDLNVEIPNSQKNENYITARDLRKLRSNPQFFLNKLANIKWESLAYMEVVDNMEKFWTVEINKCLDLVAPWKTRKQKQRKYCLPKEVRVLIQERKWLQKIHQNNLQSGIVDKEHERKFKKHNNYCNKMIKKAVLEKTGTKITNTSNINEIWKSINDILNPEMDAKKCLKIETERPND